MTKILRTLTLLALAFLSAPAVAQDAELFRDMNAPMDARIHDLLDRLTVDEKIQLMVNDASAIDRLGIDKYNHGNEALHGVVRPGTFTVFPQAIALSATWNPSLIHEVATAISDEARARWRELDYGRLQHDNASDLLTFWSPTINMARDPRWGRTPETYGEDPFLTGTIAEQFVRGLQGDHPRYLKVVSTPKHFAANNEEHNRASCDARITERDLREYYLPAFERCIVDAKAQSIMTAYNAVNGVPCTSNTYLVKKVLRGDWGFQGYVVSDCGAPQQMVTHHHYVKDYATAAALAIHAGLDLECGNCVYAQPLREAYDNEMISAAELDSAVYHILRGRMLLGLFDDPAANPYNFIDPAVIGCPEHQQLALETARQSIVLLKNQKAMLPLSEKKTKSIALVGPLAGYCEFGDYSGNPKNTPVSILDGLKAYGEEHGIAINYAPWTSTGSELEPITQRYFPEGVHVDYYSGTELSGMVHSRVEEDIHYDPASKPDPFQPSAPMSARWSGKLCPPVSGTYVLGMKVDDGFRLYIDGKLVMEDWYDHPAKMTAAEYDFEAGRTYDVTVEYFDGGGECICGFYWTLPSDDYDSMSLYGDAARVAAESDVTVAVLGINKSIEHEGQDRNSIELPADQQRFIREMCKINPRTVVVLVTGSPLSVRWIQDNVPAVLDVWYPGEQGGNAVTDVLFGKYNPAGRLPLTFYESLDEIPAFNDYTVLNRTYQYFTGHAVYPFGYGLSYTTFGYSRLQTSADDESVTVSFRVRNTGRCKGDEVAQVYVRYPETGTYMPLKQLHGFQRVTLEKGETKTVTITIPKKELRYWNTTQGGFVTPSGEYQIMVGASSADIRLTGSVVL